MDAKKYLPEVLTGVGIGGIFGTAVFTAEATIKSVRDVDAKTAELKRPLTVKEKIALCWRNYIKAAVMGVSSAVCIVASDNIQTKRYAAVATAFGMASTSLKELTAKIPEVVGEEKAEEIHKAVVQEKLNNTPVPTDISEEYEKEREKAPQTFCTDVAVADDNRILCYDERFGRYFLSNKREITEAEDEINRLIISEGYASLNDFYTILHMSPTTGGDDLGWNGSREGYLDIRFSTMLAPDGRPCLTIDYFIGPREDYADFR